MAPARSIPLFTYLVVEGLRLDDDSGAVVLHGLGGVLGLLAPAFLASGQYGAGWNGLGADAYLGVAGQGVTGLWAAVGRQPDWPGQLIAQGVGIGACIILPVALALVILGVSRGVQLAWRAAGKR